MIITRKGSLIPSVRLGSLGHVTKVVLEISNQTKYLRHICSHYFYYQRLYIVVCYSFDVTISDLRKYSNTKGDKLFYPISAKVCSRHSEE